MRTRAALTLLAAATLCACEGPGDRLLVTSGFTDQLFVLDATTGDVVDSLALDRRPGERDEPHGVAVSPDGQHFYVTLAHGEPSLWKYETRGLRLVGRVTLPTNGASRVRLSPDGAVAAVPDYWLNGGGVTSKVAFVNTHDLTVIATPDVCPAPHDAAYSPQGTLIAVACAGNDEVVVLDTDRLTVTERYAARRGSKPMNVAWPENGRPLLVTLGMGSEVLVKDLALDNRGGTFATIPTDPGGAQVEVAGRTGIVANRRAGTVSIVDVDNRSSRTVLVPGAHPHGVALSADGRTAYVTYEGDIESLGGVVAIDVATREIVWRTDVGVFTLGVAFLPG